MTLRVCESVDAQNGRVVFYTRRVRSETDYAVIVGHIRPTLCSLSEGDKMRDEQEPKLKACLFCETTEEIVYHRGEPAYLYIHEFANSGEHFYVNCGRCGATGPRAISRRLAAVKWNRRAGNKIPKARHNNAPNLDPPKLRKDCFLKGGCLGWTAGCFCSQYKQS